ncbi:hypothetical protein lerEdw1_019825 [Lerista edwardsae]|nr:hypothetical protein lerEdw1_019825 [Lerista edwardsae]
MPARCPFRAPQASSPASVAQLCRSLPRSLAPLPRSEAAPRSLQSAAPGGAGEEGERERRLRARRIGGGSGSAMAAPFGAAGGGLGALGPGEAAAAAHALSLPAEAFGNDPAVEMIWAMKAHQHAEVYYNLISSVDPQFLKLTKADDQIYAEFRKNFRDLKIDVLDPEDLKSEPAKEKWRPFCMQFDGVVEDFNYGTLLRLDCSQGYSEENTVFATRIQFFAIEIARNREGCNRVVYHRAREASSAPEEMSSG